MYGFSSSAPMAACQEGCNAPGCWLGIKNSVESAGRSDIFVAMPANSGPINTDIQTGLSARFVGMAHSHTINRDKNVAPTKPSDPACLITTKLASLMFFPAHSVIAIRLTGDGRRKTNFAAAHSAWASPISRPAGGRSPALGRQRRPYQPKGLTRPPSRQKCRSYKTIRSSVFNHDKIGVPDVFSGPFGNRYTLNGRRKTQNQLRSSPLRLCIFRLPSSLWAKPAAAKHLLRHRLHVR